jgi:hypothetical protein
MSVAMSDTVSSFQPASHDAGRFFQQLLDDPVLGALIRERQVCR